MAQALPPDVRANRPFRIIKGLDDNVIRTDYTIDSGVTSIAQGEWVTLDASNNVVKCTGDLTNPDQNVVCNWTSFERDDTSAGQADTVATNQITAVTGSYQAETEFFDPGGTFTAGFLLVARASSGAGNPGVLDAVDSAAASNEQLGASVGRVVSFAGGILTYRTDGRA